jgi:tetratricopeptide (TPR) repeat protein
MISRRSILMSGPAVLFGVATASRANDDAALQATSFLGRKLYALPDSDGAIAAARVKLAADPKNADLALKLAKAQAAKRQYREAVATCTEALTASPNNASLFVERGHRLLGLRQFETAFRDLSQAASLDPKQLDAHYHLGLARYFLRQYARAAEAFGRALALAQSADSVIDCSNWFYVSLRRSGQLAAANEVLSHITPEVKNTEPHLFFYLQLLRFYQGKLSEAQILPPKPAGPADIEGELSFNTINYGIGNWHLYNDDRPHAGTFFKAASSGEAWNSWGFIGSEIELAKDPRL